MTTCSKLDDSITRDEAEADFVYDYLLIQIIVTCNSGTRDGYINMMVCFKHVIVKGEYCELTIIDASFEYKCI